MNLSKTLNLLNPEDIQSLDDVKRQFRHLVDELQRQHRAIYDTFAGEVMAETPLWRLKQVDGDLRAEKKVSGTFVDKGGYTE